MFFCKKRHVFLNDNWCKIARFLRCNQEDSPNFLMDASAVVMELGLSMQKAESFFFSPKIYFGRSKYQGFKGSYFMDKCTYLGTNLGGGNSNIFLFSPRKLGR